MTCSSNYNLFFLALVLCTTNIRSESDSYNHNKESTKLRKSNPNNIVITITFDNIFYSQNISAMSSKRSKFERMYKRRHRKPKAVLGKG